MDKRQKQLWIHPYIIECILAYTLGAAYMPAYLTYVVGRAGIHPIAIGNIVHNGLQFCTCYLYTKYEQWRRWLATHLVLVLALDGLTNTLITVALMCDVIEPSKYVMTIPIINCTIGATVMSIWRMIPNILFDRETRKVFDQVERQAQLVGAMLGNILVCVCVLDLVDVCILLIALSWLDNAFLVWMCWHYREINVESLTKL